MRVQSPAPREEWRAVWSSDPRALPEHAPEWTDALTEIGPYVDASRYYLMPDGREFVLPLVRRRGIAGLGGWFLSYPPSWGMGGLIGADVDADVLGAVLADLRALPAQRVWLRPDPTLAATWGAVLDDPVAAAGVVRVPRRAHVVDLTGGPEAVWAGLSKSARRGARTAERAGIRIEVDRSGELLEEYYKLYLLSVDRWAARQHEPRRLAHARAKRRDPLPKLQALSRHLGKACVVTLAYLEGQPVSGSITLLGPTAHDTRAAMDADRIGKTYAGDLVQWTTLQLACDHGCSAYHLGESGQNASLALFKEKFGARPVDYAELRLERLPYTRTDAAARTLAKRLLRFRDV